MGNEIFDLDAFRAQPLPTESEIIANWQGDLEKPVVSILCHMFNQEMYIEDAFRGFLTQKTDFVFEVIAHDDASTDRTPEIIREYVKRYPKIFKPVIQIENQYSKGAKPCLLSSPHAKGEYFALCEGDDFWIDDKKLQKQYSSLLNHPGVKICFTQGLGLTNLNTTKEISNYGKNEKIYNVSKVARGGGGFMPTASLFIHKEIILNLPDWFQEAPVGDFYIQILGSMVHGALYLPSISCCYRVGAVGSWSQNKNHKNINKLIDHRRKHSLCFNRLATDYKNYWFTFKYLNFKINLRILLGFLKRTEILNFFKYLKYLVLDK